MKSIFPSVAVNTYTDEDMLKLEQKFLNKYYNPTERSSFKTLFRICRGYYTKLTVSAIFCILQLSASLFIPIATANVIDAITSQSPDQIKIIMTNLGIAAGLLLINYPMQRIYRSLRNDAIRSIEAILRGAIIAKLQRLTIAFNKEMRSGRIHSKIMRDVDSIRSLIINLHTWALHCLVQLSTVIVILIIKRNIPMLIFFAVCGPASVLMAKPFKNKLKSESRNYRKGMEETNAKVVDMVDLLPVTKAHALQNLEIKKMSKQLQESAKAGYKLDNTTDLFVVLNWLALQFFQLICLALSAYLAYNGKMTAGDVTLYFSYFSTFVSAITSITNLLPTITAGLESVNSIGEILNSNDVEDNDNKIVVKDLKGEFCFKDVKFGYRDSDRQVLKGLDLEVKAGETVAFVGESGAGKSTLINLITGFDFCNSGSITVDGIDIRDIDLDSYRKNIAVVLQSSILFSGSIRDNITYGAPNVSEEYLQQIIDLACLRDVIDALPEGLDSMVGEQGNKLSGGQRQRISIARAIIRNPKIIIFDEATSALDTVSEKHIQTAIDNLSKDKTTFIVAHRLSTVKNADKIAVLSDGKCVEFGTYDELIEKKGEFYRYRQLQV